MAGRQQQDRGQKEAKWEAEPRERRARQQRQRERPEIATEGRGIACGAFV
jgi:hypothetical protein